MLTLNKVPISFEFNLTPSSLKPSHFKSPELNLGAITIHTHIQS